GRRVAAISSRTRANDARHRNRESRGQRRPSARNVPTDPGGRLRGASHLLRRRRAVTPRALSGGLLPRGGRARTPPLLAGVGVVPWLRRSIASCRSATAPA